MNNNEQTIDNDVLSAHDAREIMARSHEYKQSLLRIFSEHIRKQAEQGLNWAHLHCELKDSPSLVSSIRDEFVLRGYVVKGEGNAITVNW